MITFTVSLVVLLILAIMLTAALIFGGVGIIVVFGDAITFVLIVWMLVRLFRFIRKKIRK